jgi:hypothetical protein
MAPPAIALQRLNQQRLSGNPFATPDEVVASFGAVQAQDYAGAKWALGLRMRDGTDDVIEQAFAAGTILRTHVMRPTWHFVTPADIRWLLELTAPRVHAVNAYMYRQLELDDALFSRTNEAIAKALDGGRQLTCAELGAALAEAGIAADGMRHGYIVMRAELDAVVCSGARRGKQFTYALLDERAPQARRLGRDEALGELTRRYYTGHGPATLHDYVWWSGLTVADARVGLAMVAADLEEGVIDGRSYWFSASVPPPPEPSLTAFLLPTYDEFLVGFAGFGAARRGGRPVGEPVVFDSALVIDGQVAGSWKRTIKKQAATIEVAPFAPLSTAESEAVASAARRYGDFVGMAVTCTILPSTARDR